MWLWISIGLAVFAAVRAPYTYRLQGTGLWLGRVLFSPSPEIPPAVILQTELSKGWPSAVAGFGAVLPFLAVGTGLLHAWWAALLALVVYLALLRVVYFSRVAPVPVEHYLGVFLDSLRRRESDLVRKKDFEAANAVHELYARVYTVLAVYSGLGVPAPDVGLADRVPLGDQGFLLHRFADWLERQNDAVKADHASRTSKDSSV